MQKGSLRCGMSVVLVFLGLLAGCQGGGSEESAGGGTARVHIQVGNGPSEQHGTSGRPSGLTEQRADGIPPEVDHITLRVTTNDQDIPGSPFPIDLETGTRSLYIQANVAHLFRVEASNPQGDIIFSGEATANLPPGADAEVPITLVAQTPVNGVPVADNKTVTTLEDTAVLITLTGSDVETAPANLTFAIATAPVHGTLSGTPPNVTYRPAANYNGPDSFTFTVTDRGDPDNCGPPSTSCAASLRSAPATVTLTVTPVNDVPVADNKTVTTLEDTAVLITLTGSDVETAPRNFTWSVTPPAHGTLAGTPPTLTYTPAANYNGADRFTFTVTDRGDPDNCGPPSLSCAAPLTSMSATVSLRVLRGKNHPPVAIVQEVETREDTPVAITLTGRDVETAPANLTFTVTTPPVHGTLSGTPPQVTYTPATNYNGPDSFTFTVTDRGAPDNCGPPSPSCAAPRTSPPATVTLTVTSVNDVPEAADDRATTPEGTAVAIPVLVNDADVDGLLNAATVDLDPSTEDVLDTTVTIAGEGTYTVDSEGLVTFVPAAGFTGAATPITYTVQDNSLQELRSNSATIRVVVNDTAPMAVADATATLANSAVTLAVLTNDSDPEGAGLTVTDPVATPPAHGTAVVQADGTIIYTPQPGFTGLDRFTYEIRDGSGDTATAVVMVRVEAGEAKFPVAEGDGATTPGGVAVIIDVQANDREPNRQPLRTASVTTPPNGDVTINPNGTVTYTPAEGFLGIDTFTYTITDPDDNMARAAVTVTVGNNAPVAQDDDFTVAEDSGTTRLDVTADNGHTPDSDVDNNLDPTTANIECATCQGVNHGTLVNNGDGTFNYTPQADFTGLDGFVYEICDMVGLCDTAEGRLTVTPVNDAPRAIFREGTTPEDTPLAITLTGNDVETAPANLTFTLETPPAHGTLSGTPPRVTYTPAANYNGPDSFTFTVTDRGDPDNCGPPSPSCASPLTSAPASVTLAVTPVNDVPRANGQSVSTPEDTPVPLTLTGSDVETAPTNLTFTVTTSPAHGTLSGTPPNVTYTPVSNYNGADSFTFTVTDRGDPDNCGPPSPSCAAPLMSLLATVSLTVTPVNDAPVAISQEVTTTEDTPMAITLTASDVETAPANFIWIMTLPAHGTLSGTPPTLTYTPAANYNGADRFIFTVTDRGDPDNCGAPSASCAAPRTSPPATVTLTVTPINDQPEATPQSVSTREDTPVAITLTGSDVETALVNLTFTIATQPARGTLSGTPPRVTYTPVPHSHGPDSFTFTVTDRGDPDNCEPPSPSCQAALTSIEARVSLTVEDVRPPIFGNVLASPHLARTTTVLTITFTVSETLQANPDVTVAGSPATFSSVTALAYTYTYTVQGEEPEGAAPIAITGSDLAGNRGTHTDAGGVTFDFTPPSATITFPGSALLTYTDVTVRGTAQDANDIANVTINGAAATTIDDFANWVATVILPLGTQVLTVTATDMAGNQATTSATVDIVDSLGSAVRGSGLGLEIPEDIAVEASGQLLVADIARRAILRVDPDTGERTVVSGCEEVTTDSCPPDNLVGNGTNFASPADVAVEASGQLLVADSALRAILRVDPDTRDRTVVSGCEVTTDPCHPDNLIGNGLSFVSPQDVAVEASGQLLVVDGNLPTIASLRAVLRVDPNTGERTVVSGCEVTTIPCPPARFIGIGPTLEFPGSIAVEASGQLLVVDIALRAVLRVDPDTGDRTVVSGCEVTTDPCPPDNLIGNGLSFVSPQDVAVEASGQLLVVDGILLTVTPASLRAVLRVDSGTGNRTVVSGCEVTTDPCPAANLIGNGPSFVLAEGLALEASGHLVMVDDFLNTVLRVDAINGDRAIISGGSIAPTVPIHASRP